MSRTCAGTSGSVSGAGGRFPSPQGMYLCPSAANARLAGEREMSRERRERILIGVLDTMTAMRRTIDDLVNSDLDQDDMLIVADVGAFFGLLERQFPPADGTEVGPAVVIRRQKSMPLIDSSPDDNFIIPDSSSFRMPQIEKWIAFGLSNTQEEHLHSGDALLVVRVRTAEQERLYSETMLIHSVDTVQLHDI